MRDTTINFLNVLVDKDILYEDDKTQIINMYNNITDYAYDDLFANNTEFNILHYFSGNTGIDKIPMETDIEKIYKLPTLDNNNLYRGTIISDDKKLCVKECKDGYGKSINNNLSERADSSVFQCKSCSVLHG